MRWTEGRTLIVLFTAASFVAHYAHFTVRACALLQLQPVTIFALFTLAAQTHRLCLQQIGQLTVVLHTTRMTTFGNVLLSPTSLVLLS